MMHKETFFYEGAIPASELTDLLALHVSDKGVGAYSMFVGQVRDDLIDDRRVVAIDFTSYEEMARTTTAAIINALIDKYSLFSLHVLQSLGIVKTGEMCLLVFSCAAHRKAAIEACHEMVERFKSEVPVWGRELFQDESYQWKVNTK